MRLHTASEVISLAKKLESESAKLYRELSIKYPKDKDLFLSLAKENETNIVQIERAYYGVISDAIEGGFAFDMESDDYNLNATLAQNASLADALHNLISIEEKIIRFYSDAAAQSDALMADIPRAFRQVVKKREARLTRLKQIV
jgi:rubrerythrin